VIILLLLGVHPAEDDVVPILVLAVVVVFVSGVAALVYCCRSQ